MTTATTTASIQGSTRDQRQFTAVTPDLLAVFTDAINEQRDQAIEAAISWSLELRADVGAEQLRREAW